MTDETYTPIIKYLSDLCDQPYSERMKAIRRLKACNRKNRQTAERNSKTSRRALQKAEKVYETNI